MTQKTKIILVSAALLTSFAAGRWLAPEKIRIEIKTVEVEKKIDQTQVDAERNRRRETTITEETRPDGTKTKTTHSTDEAETHKTVDKSTVDDVTKSTTEEKEVTRGTAKVTISALAGLKPTDLTAPPVYGLAITKPILGPITVGLWGLTSGTIGFSAGLTF